MKASGLVFGRGGGGGRGGGSPSCRTRILSEYRTRHKPYTLSTMKPLVLGLVCTSPLAKGTSPDFWVEVSSRNSAFNPKPGFFFVSRTPKPKPETLNPKTYPQNQNP